MLYHTAVINLQHSAFLWLAKPAERQLSQMLEKCGSVQLCVYKRCKDMSKM
jgi:hypothetical protein